MHEHIRGELRYEAWQKQKVTGFCQLQLHLVDGSVRSSSCDDVVLHIQQQPFSKIFTQTNTSVTILISNHYKHDQHNFFSEMFNSVKRDNTISGGHGKKSS